VIKFKVTPDHGEPYEVTATSRDVYVWEKANRGKTFRSAVESGSIVDLTEMAYHAARRHGHFSGTLVAFAQEHDIESADGDEGEPDPTNPVP
jgi:hypothetical protein